MDHSLLGAFTLHSCNGKTVIIPNSVNTPDLFLPKSELLNFKANEPKVSSMKFPKIFGSNERESTVLSQPSHLEDGTEPIEEDDASEGSILADR